eukprot:m.45102 g.45102  ORF g.45102 m.45102 type:complete len:301 (-) comp13072_c0_seq1:1023-1925(-)
MLRKQSRKLAQASWQLARNNSHVKTNIAIIDYQTTISFPNDLEPKEEWLKRQPLNELRSHFQSHGYVQVDQLLDASLLTTYQDLYSRFLSGEIDSSRHRHDLGSHNEAQQSDCENVLQVMWPSDYVQHLAEGPLHERVAMMAAWLLEGDEIGFDFDMLIAKAPHTNTAIPYHQDEAYWLDLPDKRAVSCWVALDHATKDNGCMWFVPGSHLNELLPHEKAKAGEHALQCIGNKEEGICVPLPPGSCTFHAGRTLHQTLGNTTDSHRRAYILNYRPQSMIDMSREQGFDHGRQGVHELAEE